MGSPPNGHQLRRGDLEARARDQVGFGYVAGSLARLDHIVETLTVREIPTEDLWMHTWATISSRSNDTYAGEMSIISWPHCAAFIDSCR